MRERGTDVYGKREKGYCSIVYRYIYYTETDEGDGVRTPEGEREAE